MEDSMSESRIEMTWEYKPKGFFEEPRTLDRDGYSIGIQDGTIVATMSGSHFEKHKGIKDSIMHELERYFSGSQPFRTFPFTITDAGMVEHLVDGRANVTIAIQGAVMKVSSGKLDLSYTDENGVLHDSRRSRINETHKLGELAVKFGGSDDTGRAILDSFNTAMKNSNSEFVHLFEILERLRKKFAKGKKAKNQGAAIEVNLGIAGDDQIRLTDLCNHLPVYQGRHSGNQDGKLRNATEEEKEEARMLSRKLITAYFEYLDSNSG